MDQHPVLRGINTNQHTLQGSVIKGGAGRRTVRRFGNVALAIQPDLARVCAPSASSGSSSVSLLETAQSTLLLSQTADCFSVLELFLQMTASTPCSAGSRKGALPRRHSALLTTELPPGIAGNDGPNTGRHAPPTPAVRANTSHEYLRQRCCGPRLHGPAARRG